MVYLKSFLVSVAALVSVLFLGIVGCIGGGCGSVTGLPTMAPRDSLHTTLRAHGLGHPLIIAGSIFMAGFAWDFRGSQGPIALHVENPGVRQFPPCRCARSPSAPTPSLTKARKIASQVMPFEVLKLRIGRCWMSIRKTNGVEKPRRETETSCCFVSYQFVNANHLYKT